MSPTTNMWVERGKHIGALVGGILSVLLGWVPMLFKNFWAFFFAVVASSIGIGTGKMIAYEYISLKPSTVTEIREYLAVPGRECLRNYLPKYVESKKKQKPDYFLSNKELDTARAICDEAMEKIEKARNSNAVLTEQAKAFSK